MMTPHNRSRRAGVVLSLAASIAATTSLGCSQKTCTGFEAPAVESREGALQRVADFGPLQATGVAVSKSGRIFVNFPRWGGEHRFSVAEVLADGSVTAYPDVAWNTLTSQGGAGGTFRAAEEVEVDENGTPIAPAPVSSAGPLNFVCVQSVYIDAKDRLWVLDAASPSFAGVSNEGGGPKLVEIDLVTNQAVRAIQFDADTAPFNSYLNDVRIDTTDEYAFITDSGAGAIIVVDLTAGKARRLLADDPSVKANPNRALLVGGGEVRNRQTGGTPQIHADGIALDIKNNLLYWQSLTNDRLYAMDTRLLKSRTVPAWQINNSVRDLGTTCVTDGMHCDGSGDIYFTALELDAVVFLDSASARRAFREGQPRDFSRSLRTVTQSPFLGWPDSLAFGPVGPIGPDGVAYTGGGKFLYITTSQIHRSARFGGNVDAQTKTGEGESATEPGNGFALYRVRVPQ